MSTDYITFCENTAKRGKIQILLSYNGKNYGSWKNDTVICLLAYDDEDYFRLDKHIHTRKMKVKPFKKNSYWLDKTKFDRIYNNYQKLTLKRNFKKHLNKVLKYACNPDPEDINKPNIFCI